MARAAGQELGPVCTFPWTVTEAGLRSALPARAVLPHVPWARCPPAQDLSPSVLGSHEAICSHWISDRRLVVAVEGLGPPAGLVPHNATGLGSRSSSHSRCPSHLKTRSAWPRAGLLAHPSNGGQAGCTAGGWRPKAPLSLTAPCLPMEGPSLSSVPPGSADGRGLSFSLGPLNYCPNGLLSELGLFFVEAGWARLPEGLLMTGETTPLPPWDPVSFRSLKSGLGRSSRQLD